MSAARLAFSLVLFAGTVAAVRLDAVPAGILMIAAVVTHVALRREWRTLLRMAVPVLLFAFAVLAAQWAGGAVDPAMPIRTVAVFLLTTAGFHVLPWTAMAGRISVRSRLYLPVLFLLFVRHFTEILLAEARRVLQARSFCIARSLGPGSFPSLAWALASLFRRGLDRAERFYAAQSIGGVAE